MAAADPEGNLTQAGNLPRLCRRLLEHKRGRFICTATHRSAAQDSYKFGPGYIVRCPAGVFFYTIPMEKQLLVGGFCLLHAPDDASREDLIDLAQELRAGSIISPRLLGDIRVLGKEALIDEILKVEAGLAAQGLIDLGTLKELENREYQQAEIADEIIRQKRGRASLKRFFVVEKELLQRAKAGDRNGAREIMNQLLGMIYFSTGMNIQLIKLRVLELIVLLSRLAVENDFPPEEIFSENLQHMIELFDISSLEELSPWTTRVLDSFLDKFISLGPEPRPDKLSRVLRLLDQNPNRRISLAEAAATACLSPSRFSHFFKQEIGETYRGYRLRRKIEYAKHLLATTRIPIVEIATDLVFSDQSYFTRTFKRFAGMTPQRYRRDARKG
jgi:two-component system response regulator YesN